MAIIEADCTVFVFTVLFLMPLEMIKHEGVAAHDFFISLFICILSLHYNVGHYFICFQCWYLQTLSDDQLVE